MLNKWSPKKTDSLTVTDDGRTNVTPTAGQFWEVNQANQLKWGIWTLEVFFFTVKNYINNNILLLLAYKHR